MKNKKDAKTKRFKLNAYIVVKRHTLMIN